MLFKKGTIAVCVLFALFAASVPVLRSFSLCDVGYNEGWNAYNAQALTAGRLLYPVPYGWTSVNYPMLSFSLMAALHHLTHDYLFTARLLSILSLLLCALLSGAIVRSLGAGRQAAILAGLFCWTAFCVGADSYVGMDDPQLLAHAIFLTGLLVYVRHRHSAPYLAGAAFIFTVALFVKHNPVDFTAAVLIDLTIASIPFALWFSLWSLVFTGLALALTLHFGGPFFLSQLFSPRTYLPLQVPDQFFNVIGPILVPFTAAVYTAWTQRNRSNRRVISILLVATVVISGYFSGGDGVTINGLFSVLIATSILVGLFLDDAVMERIPRLPRSAVRWAPAGCFGWLLIPLIVSGNWNPVARLRETAAASTSFREDVTFLRERPGPALCENLLECFEAGKPYVYDPFNATRLIHFGKLDEAALVTQIQEHRFAAVQTDAPLAWAEKLENQRFSPAIRTAIEMNYAPAPQYARTVRLGDAGGRSVVIYVPRVNPPQGGIKLPDEHRRTD